MFVIPGCDLDRGECGRSVGWRTCSCKNLPPSLVCLFGWLLFVWLFFCFWLFEPVWISPIKVNVHGIRNGDDCAQFENHSFFVAMFAEPSTQQHLAYIWILWRTRRSQNGHEIQFPAFHLQRISSTGTSCPTNKRDRMLKLLYFEAFGIIFSTDQVQVKHETL